jgi:hypothetical protein
LGPQSSKPNNAADGFGRKCAYFKILLPKILSNGQNKQVSPIQQRDKMTV